MSPADCINSLETVTRLAIGINMNQQEKEEMAIKIYRKMTNFIADIYLEMDEKPAYIYIGFPDRIVVDDTTFTHFEMIKLTSEFFNKRQARIG